MCMLRIHKARGTAVVTAGKGLGSSSLSAFDSAELDANIFALNAVKFSSFVPPGWGVSMDKELLSEHTHSGRCLPMAYEYACSSTDVVSAAVAIGVPRDKANPCIIMEYSSNRLTGQELAEQAEAAVKEVFGFRKWELKKVVKKSVEAVPKKSQHACALAVVVFLPFH